VKFWSAPPTKIWTATDFSLMADSSNVDAVKQDIRKVLLNENGNSCPLAVRLAWHSSGTYSKEDNTGGSNGATMRFAPEKDEGANAGLDIERDALEAVKKAHPACSYADIWTLAGAVAIEAAGGPVIDHKLGRSDAADGSACPMTGRLPDASQGAQHLRDVFYRMGFDDEAIVALSGAHTLGRCHTVRPNLTACCACVRWLAGARVRPRPSGLPLVLRARHSADPDIRTPISAAANPALRPAAPAQDRSGFDGPWTENPLEFDNSYFTNLMNIDWQPRVWDGPLQYENPAKTIMMLPSDLALKTDPEFSKYCVAFAKDEAAFRASFKKAYEKLISLGVPEAAP